MNEEEKMSDDQVELRARLWQTGQGIARDLLVEAVKTAENDNQLQNQLFVCRATAIHLMATFFGNALEDGKSAVEFMDHLQSDINEEWDSFNKDSRVQLAAGEDPTKGKPRYDQTH